MTGQVKREIKEKGSEASSGLESQLTWDFDSKSDTYQGGNLIDSNEQHLSFSKLSTTQLDRSYLRTEGWDLSLPSFALFQKLGLIAPQTNFFQTELNGSCVMTGKIHIHQSKPFFSYLYENDQTLTPQSSYVDPAFELAFNEPLSDIGDINTILADYPATAQLQKAAGRIYTTGYDVLTAGFEAKKTIRIFFGIKKRLIKFFTSRQWYNAYLEGRYAWRTLVYDIMSLYKAVTGLQGEQRTRFSETVGIQHTLLDSVETDVNFRELSLPDDLRAATGNVRFGYKLKRTTSYELSVRGNVVADLGRTSQVLGLQHQFFADYITTGWELIPYSFVIDRFIDIGSALASFNLKYEALDLQASAGYELRTKRTDEIVDFNVINSQSWKMMNEGLVGQSTLERVTVARRPEVIPILPTPNPRIDKLFLLDMAALILQLADFKRR